MSRKSYGNFKDFVKDHIEDIKKIELLKKDGATHFDACSKVWPEIKSNKPFKNDALKRAS